MGPAKGAVSDVYFPGFPTLKHIKYEVSINRNLMYVVNFIMIHFFKGFNQA